MKYILILVFALALGNLMQAQENGNLSMEQLPDASLFEAHYHIEDNDTLPYRLKPCLWSSSCMVQESVAMTTVCS